MTAIEQELHDRFGELLRPAGYKLTRVDRYSEGFVRVDNGIRRSIFIPVWDHAPAFQFSLTICLRLEVVEKLFLPFSGILPNFHMSSDTCVMNLSAFIPELHRITVYDAGTIQQSVHQLASCITNQILPFLEAHRDVKSLDRLMNQQRLPQEPANLWSFGMHAVIIAHLAQNPEFDTLVERYRNELRECDDDERESYEKLVEHLRSLP